MGEARRKQLAAAEKKVKRLRGALFSKEEELERLKEKSARAQEKVDAVRKEFDDLTYPAMQNALEDLADEAGPTLLPKEDEVIARFILDSKVPPPKDMTPIVFQFLACKLAALIALLIVKNEEVCARAHAILNTVMREEDGTPATSIFEGIAARGVSEVLALVYAKRMLDEKKANEAGHFIPFTETDWSKYMTPKEVVTHAKAGIEAFMDAHREEPTEALVLDRFTDQRLTALGVHFWEKTYKIGGSDDDLFRILKDQFESQSSRDLCAFAAKWAVHAFQRITTTHTYAAALMCSDADHVVLQDIEVQWYGFMITVPNGMFPYHDDSLNRDSEYNRILVSVFDHYAQLVLFDQSAPAVAPKTSSAMLSQTASSLATLLDVGGGSGERVDPDENIDLSSATIARMQRILIMAKRLVAGLLLSLQNQNNFKSKVYPARDGKRHREAGAEPEHRVVFVGAPLKIDCRPKVMDFIHNGPGRKGAPPQVQFIVRGHYKRQVIGIGRLGRKVIWIEPFWKGREDAPILTRPKKVGG